MTSGGGAAAGEVAAGRGDRIWRLGLLGGALLLVAALLILVSGPALYRAGMLDLESATAGVARTALFVVLPAALVGLVTLVASFIGKSTRGAIVGVLVLLAASLMGFRIYGYFVQRDGMPPVWDAQSDWAEPVAFSVRALEVRDAEGAAPVRDNAMIPPTAGKWGGKTVAQAQAEFFDDIGPLHVNAPPAEATVAAAHAAKTLGWHVMLSDPPNGQLEAVSRSTWYGLPADIAVRIRPDGSGSRVDVRSTGRIPAPDLGSNASRVKQMLDAIAFEMRAVGSSSEVEAPAS
ncbi:MAG: DUF1499 domain-containing protein [Hyphomonadaceae bacterium]